jgi:threonine dehydrogenase-like Zn-dependent dehydrogenase
MKAVAVTPNTKKIEVIATHPEPALETDTDVLLDMLDIGVCGTDREIARFDYGTPPPGSDYLVIGHESLAKVARVGSKVTRVAPGDLVVTMVRRPCDRPDCRACRAGRQDFCFTGEFTERGIKGRHGFMTERVVDDERYMHRVPRELRDFGVLVEPLTIAEKALIQVWDVQDRLPWKGQRAVVLGAGPVGLLGAFALIARGFETWVYSRLHAGSPVPGLVSAIGGHFVSSDTPLAELARQVGNIDLVYEATGAAKVSFDALGVLGVNGVFVFTGVPGRKAPIELAADALMRDMVLKNQLVFGTVNAGADAFAAAIADLARFPRDAVTQLITGRFAPADAPRLLSAQRDADGIKNVVSFG